MKQARCFVLFVALAAGGCARSSPEQQVVDDAASALGGRDRILAAKTLVVEGEGRQWNLGQDMTPEAASQTFTITYRRAIDLGAWRSRTEQTRTPNFNYFQGPAPQKRVLGVDSEMGYDIRPDGTSARIPDPPARDRRTELYHHPVTIVRAALDPSSKLANARATGSERAVEVTTPSGMKFTLAIDGVTGLPTRVVSMTHNGVLGDVAIETAFADYQEASGLKLPTHLVTKVDAFTVADIRAKTSAVDTGTGDLTTPATLPKGPGIEEAPVNVTVEEVAKGVWLLGGQSHHSVAVEFADHITLIEAPSESRTLAVIAKARELRPGKPVTAVVNSHHHFDHSGGVRAAVSEGLTVITHKANAAFFNDLVGRNRTIAPDALARSPKPLTLRTVDDELVLKDEMREMRLYHIAGNPHGDAMLMAYLPRERILVQADAFSGGSPRQPYAANLLENIRKRDLRVDRMVSIHGPVAPFTDLVTAVQPTATNE